MNRLRRQLLLAGSWSAASVALPFAHAADAISWPGRAVRFIVPYPPGGSADIIARLIQTRLAPKLGQPVVVENKTGAGGNVGTDFVAKAPADGYTILLAGGGPMAVAKALYGDTLTYDPARDLRGVVQLAEFPMVLLVNPKAVDARSPAEFIKWVKEGPESRRTFGSAGAGTPQHLLTEYFARQFGLKLTHVPYRGSAPTVQAVIAGEVPFAFETLTASLQQIRGGTIRALAVSTGSRAEQISDVPTIAETVSPRFHFGTWSGIACPRGTPDAVVLKLNQALQEILREPDTSAKWHALGARVAGGTAAEFDVFLRSETERLGGLVATLGLKA